MEDLTADQLRQWERTLRERLDALQLQLQPLLAESERARQQLALVQRLLSVTEGQLTSETVPPVSRDESVAAAGGTIADAVASILEAAGKPLHIREIRERFLASGRVIPGQGTESNLLAYIGRDGRFVRVGRGTYTISSGADAPAVKAVKTRKRRKKSR